ncbi:TetR/AcrR family transcriptional regulator [Parvularcula maris]|uniref:TetR/AcrR family transcriptional regulator n=1 Tax=Parvularcula maris TaxID=2965077 RepID=A0A9X2L9K3_9PROT|nr:TetR/AcrR family transcriptional regulator [Parvularcula maris]MCQ8185562.1 TetR/AcrR family transcriptional regulator [Parvularcula maris]
MARTPQNTKPELVEAIGTVFREAGYGGASLTKLSEATGLKRASLYHRFPSGKEAMAEEALASTVRFVDERILSVLRGLGEPREKLEAAAAGFRTLYRDGGQSCLINLFGTPSGNPESLRQGAQTLVSSLISAISKVLASAGVPEDEARRRGLKAVVDIQGALVLARVYGDKAPFKAVMAGWTEDLLRGSEEVGDQKPPQQPQAEVREVQITADKPETPSASRDVRKAVAAHLSALKLRGEG